MISVIHRFYWFCLLILLFFLISALRLKQVLFYHTLASIQCKHWVVALMISISLNYLLIIDLVLFSISLFLNLFRWDFISILVLELGSECRDLHRVLGNLHGDLCFNLDGSVKLICHFQSYPLFVNLLLLLISELFSWFLFTLNSYHYRLLSL